MILLGNYEIKGAYYFRHSSPSDLSFSQYPLLKYGNKEKSLRSQRKAKVIDLSFTFRKILRKWWENEELQKDLDNRTEFSKNIRSKFLSPKVSFNHKDSVKDFAWNFCTLKYNYIISRINCKQSWGWKSNQILVRVTLYKTFLQKN